MCIAVVKMDSTAKYPLIIGFNRDEFYNRSYNAASHIEEGIFAPQDLVSKGTWLGASRAGKIGLLTNFRDPLNQRKDIKSRGQIIVDYLQSTSTASNFIEQIKKNRNSYSLFNLLLIEKGKINYYCSKTNEKKAFNDGLYSLSNGIIENEWPKMAKIKNDLSDITCLGPHNEIQDRVFKALSDEELVQDDNLLPKTGLDLAAERMISSVFVKSPNYGTVHNCCIIYEKKNKLLHFYERYGYETDDYQSAYNEITINEEIF